MSDDPAAFRITTLWAWLAVNEGGEGVIGAPAPGGGTLPLIAADRARLEELRPFALIVAARMGTPVVLARFDVRTDVMTVHPDMLRAEHEFYGERAGAKRAGS